MNPKTSKDKPEPSKDKPSDGGRRKSLGRAGEEAAIRYLEEKKYKILVRNYRQRSGEIDIIATRGRLLVFFEVKSLLGPGGDPEAYSMRQQRRLAELSECFLAQNAVSLPAEYDVRYDYIRVGRGVDGRLMVLEHIEDAFRPV
jgi:putative endonuclease